MEELGIVGVGCVRMPSTHFPCLTTSFSFGGDNLFPIGYSLWIELILMRFVVQVRPISFFLTGIWVLSRGTKRMGMLGMSSRLSGVPYPDFCDPGCGSYFLDSRAWLLLVHFWDWVSSLPSSLWAPYILLLNSLWLMLARGVSVACSQRTLMDTSYHVHLLSYPMHHGYWLSVQCIQCLLRLSIYLDIHTKTV